jgi:plasmid stabilization system protein ParE
MDFKIVLSSEAIKELQESIDWYESRSEGLGLRFIAFIDKAFTLMLQNPEGYPVKREPYRVLVLGKFPYLIIYELISEQHAIFVLHIFHTKRDPSHKIRKK